MHRWVSIFGTTAMSLCGASMAAQVVVPPGATLALPGGTLTLSCADLALQGTMSAGSSHVGTAGNLTIAAGGVFAAGSSTLTVGGNWTNAGTFTPGTSTVAFADGCTTAPAQLTGTTAFANLTLSSATGRSIVLPTGGAISVAGQLALSGVPATPIQLVAAAPPQPASIVLGPAASVTQAHVQLGPNVVLDGTAIPRLANISTRTQVLAGADVMIGGFIIGGSLNKTVVVRARGPSLAQAGIPGVLANPLLQLFSGATQVAVNDNWGDAANAAALATSGFAPSDPLESAILATLAPGAYTAIVSGVGSAPGIGIVEVFEVDAQFVPLVNIATRGRVQGGDKVMIGGFIIQGSGPQTVVVRARGPSLAQAGVPGVLANPVLQLFSGATRIDVNDNWQDTNAAAIQASGFAPSDPLEAAILITLQPGAYTAIVTGAGGTTGVGIVEVFRN